MSTLLFVGCPTREPLQTTAIPSQSLMDRPPLRIHLAVHDGFAESLQRRWQAVSEQRLELRSVDIDKLLAAERLDCDLVILESRWLAEFVEHEVIVPLPKELAAGDSQQEGGEAGGLMEMWPSVWRRSVGYGQRVWGIPLGVPLLARIAHRDSLGLPDSASAPAQENAKLAYPPRVADWMVDYFLAFAASRNPQPDRDSFLFNTNNARARLTEAWFVEAAMEFGRVAKSERGLPLGTPAANWRWIEGTAGIWGYGWPDGSDAANLTLESPQPWLDAGRGWVVAMARTNRQTATSVRFLRWLNEDAQRAAFSEFDVSIQTNLDRASRAGDRAADQRYYELLRIGSEDPWVVRELTFAGATEYRQLLAEALDRIVVDPESARRELEQCNRAWDDLSKRNGVGIMRRRFGLASDLEELSDR